MLNVRSGKVESAQDRLVWLDCAKGMALLLVIFGHCFRDAMRETSAICAFLYDFVYAFHVPLFFFAAGMCYTLRRGQYRGKGYLSSLVGKVRAYLLPWVSYSVLIYLLFALTQAIGPLAQLLPAGYKLVEPVEYLRRMLHNENPYAFHLWYLLEEFLFFVLVRTVDCLRDERAFHLAITGLLVLSGVIYVLFAEHAVWTIKGFFQQLPYFLLGVLVPVTQVEKRGGMLMALGTVGLVNVVMRSCGLVPEVDGGAMLRVAHHLLSTGSVMLLMMGIAAVCSRARRTGMVQLLADFGQRSLMWYLYHQPFCGALLGSVLYDHLGLPIALCVSVCMTASLVFPVVVVRVTRLLRLQGLFRYLGLPC